MIVKAVHIEHFRCIRVETLHCEALTVLVGANGTGKSAFLHALDVFYKPDATLDKEDFFAHDTSHDVKIAVTFAQLAPDAQALFTKYVENEELTVTRVIKWRESDGRTTSSYHGTKLQVKAFAAIRGAGNAMDMRKAYGELRQVAPYTSLPTVGSKEAVLAALDQWEAQNAQSCERIVDDGQFFGYKEVSAGYLGRFTRLIVVPAVRDASEDGEEGRGSLFTQLIDIAVRSNTAGDVELAALGDEMKQRYRTIVETTKSNELKKVEEELTAVLAGYVSASDVQLSWDEMPQVQLPPPRAVAKIGEEGHRSAIERKGHGLQRAFIITLLQYLEAIRARPKAPPIDGGADALTPSVILAIEEPELYQHPDRQRHFAKLLARLAMLGGKATEASTQVLYTTHSPHFVGLDRFGSIRLMRKRRGDGDPVPETRIASLSLSVVAGQLAGALEKDPALFTAESLRMRLQTLMTPWMNEGFFAEVVVLVEGEQDRAAILAAAVLCGQDLESIGVAVIPCMGKANLDRPFLVFQGLGIPTYCIWDSDEANHDPKPHANRLLLRLVGATEEDYPAAVSGGYACFRRDLEAMLEAELTAAVMEPLVKQLQDEYEMKKDDILKNPAMMTQLLKRASEKGATSTSLASIIEKVLDLKSA